MAIVNITGDSFEEFWLNFLTEVRAGGRFKLCNYEEATNDAASSVTPEQHALNIKTILNYLITNRIKPIMLISPPHNDEARSILIDTMNMYDYVTAQELDVPCIDIWEDIVDVTDGSFLPNTADDDTHPNNQSHKGAGTKLIDKWQNNKYYIPLPRNNNNSGVNPNACFLNTSGTNQPANWATNGNDVSKLLSVTPLAKGNTWETRWTNDAIFFNSSRWNVTAGDRYLFVIRFGLDVTSGSVPFSFFLEYDTAVGTPAVTRVYFMRENELAVEDTTFSLDFVVPAGVSTIRYAGSSSAGTFDTTIRVGQAQMYNLTEHTTTQ